MVYAILRLRKCVTQSRDRTHVLRNPEIACAISGFRECATQSRDYANSQIARNIYTHPIHYYHRYYITYFSLRQTDLPHVQVSAFSFAVLSSHKDENKSKVEDVTRSSSQVAGEREAAVAGERETAVADKREAAVADKREAAMAGEWEAAVPGEQ